LAGSTLLKYVFSGKLLIAPEPEVGNFQKWVEMKVNYPTNKKYTHKEFSDHFHNIENFIQLTDVSKFRKTALFFHFSAPGISTVIGKTFSRRKNKHI
jgi:hypothetical protein